LVKAELLLPLFLRELYRLLCYLLGAEEEGKFLRLFAGDTVWVVQELKGVMDEV
jgi:hypothetical protein